MTSTGPFPWGVYVRGFTVKAIIGKGSRFLDGEGSLTAVLLAGDGWNKSAGSGQNDINTVVDDSGTDVRKDITFHMNPVRIAEKGEYQLTVKIVFVDGREGEVIASAENVGRLAVN